jgi:hypothetical protein
MSGSVTLTVSVTQFQTDRPEFSNETAYPVPIVTRYLTIAQNQLDPCKWADLLVEGIELYACHMLALYKRNQQPNAQGTSGLILSKTLGRGSMDFDTSAVTLKDGGPWNLTTYGTQLLYWARLVGMGGLQITGPFMPTETTLGMINPAGGSPYPSCGPSPPAASTFTTSSATPTIVGTVPIVGSAGAAVSLRGTVTARNTTTGAAINWDVAALVEQAGTSNATITQQSVTSFVADTSMAGCALVVALSGSVITLVGTGLAGTSISWSTGINATVA